MSELPSFDPPPDAAVLRLLDANANRSREALRVLEDYARFVLDDGDLSRELKSVRHELAGAIGDLLTDAIVHRDTPGDVGTGNKVPTEFARTDVGDVVTAAGKRLGEALWSIEEYLKTIDPTRAAHVETLRYRCYDLECRVAWTLRPPTCGFADEVELYVLVTESVCKRPWQDAAVEALIGGADCLQLREKHLESGELLRRARQLVALCREFGVCCVINDRPDIAVLSGADGVHVGQDDLPAAEARRIVGPRRLVGVSTHRIEQAKQAVIDGADYVGVGPFFRSTTKPRDFVAGPAYAKQVVEQVKLPAVAIAGITAGNVDEVLATGIKAVAVSAAVLGADDVAGAARELKDRLKGGQTFLSVTRDQRAASNVGPPSAGVPIALQITRRHLPHRQLKGATYFITFRLRRGELDLGERSVVLDHLRSGHGKFYALIATVVMPDHVHVLLTPRNGYSLDRAMKGTKGVTANLLNRRWKRKGPVWQEESWDRIVRDRDDLYEQLKYMLDNPVRKRLVTDGWDYDGWYYNPEPG